MSCYFSLTVPSSGEACAMRISNSSFPSVPIAMKLPALPVYEIWPSWQLNHWAVYHHRTFSPSHLQELRTEVVDSIYGCIPKQCKACGLRIRKDKEYAAHLDWHFMRRAKQRGADVAERGWFVHKTQWLQGVGDIVTVETGTGKLGAERKTEVGEDKEDEIISVPVDDAQPECSLCSESFEVFWNA